MNTGEGYVFTQGYFYPSKNMQYLKQLAVLVSGHPVLSYHYLIIDFSVCQMLCNIQRTRPNKIKIKSNYHIYYHSYHKYQHHHHYHHHHYQDYHYQYYYYSY